jgi:peptidoglycan/LPS O-acetylase OafA/YrhL
MRRYILKLEALRGLAAQPVVLSHSAVLVFAPSPAITAIGWAAHLSVIFFFVLSGFAIIGGLREELRANGAINIKDFGIRRIARIYPPYLLALALVAIYFALPGSMIDASKYNTSLPAFGRALMFAFTSNDAIVLAPVWSLRIEVLLYAIAGLSFFSLGLKARMRFAVATAAALLAAVMCWKLSFGFSSLVFFAGGGLLHTLVGRGPPKAEADLWRSIAPLSAWSYTLYLVHMPVVLLTIECLKPLGFSAVMLVAASIISANISSALFSRIVERPHEIANLLRGIPKVAGPASA